MPADQVKKIFAADISKLGYIVIEIGIYPDRDVEVAGRDFVLRVSADGGTLRPVTPGVIAAKLDDHKPSAPPKIPERVQVHGSETIGVATGTYNGRRQTGVYTESTVGVGIGDPRNTPPPPPPSSRKPKIDKADLESVALPDGRWGHPVAGYLYFPAPAKKGPVELTWYAADGVVRLSLPPTK